MRSTSSSSTSPATTGPPEAPCGAIRGPGRRAEAGTLRAPSEAAAGAHAGPAGKKRSNVAHLRFVREAAPHHLARVLVDEAVERVGDLLFFQGEQDLDRFLLRLGE